MRDIDRMAVAIILLLIIFLILTSFAMQKDNTAEQEPKSEIIIDTRQLEEPRVISLGEFKVTVYTPYCDGGIWGYKTATGKKSKHLSTCAVDPDIIKLGSKLKLKDLKLSAVDTGSAVKGKVIDVFYDGTQKEAVKWLSEYIGDNAEIYIER